MKPNANATERFRIATEGWGAKLLARQSPAGNWGGPRGDRGLLVTLYSLVVLMDLGLDPASKQARDKRFEKAGALRQLRCCGRAEPPYAGARARLAPRNPRVAASPAHPVSD